MRKDIQYLRTLAVLGVVLFHLWPRLLTGGYVGVDIFFVISGFLITSHLVKELKRDGKLSFSAFYARRARRILPAALFVLLVTFVGILTFSLESDWANFFKQTFSSALFYENWILAIDSVDYLAADNAPSPVQHYWSLSVEEQFYLIWPLLTYGIYRLTLAAKSRSLAPLIWLLSAIATISLVWSIYQTEVDAPPAYFSTFTRAWEFAAGGILAIAVTFANRAPIAFRRSVSALGWIGLLASCLAYTPDTPFPSYTAALPVFSAVAVIWASVGDIHWVKPFKFIQASLLFIADISFSLYLWHWPLIVFAKNYRGRELTLKESLAVFAVSILLAWLTTRFVEKPFRFSKGASKAAPRKVLSLALAALAITSLTFWGGWSVSERTAFLANQAVEAAQKSPQKCSGAGFLVPANHCGKESFKNLNPEPLYANSAKSKIATGTACSTDSDSSEVVSCTFGKRNSKFKVALLGDSHAMAIFPAIEQIALEQGWSLTTYVRSACPFIGRAFIKTETAKMRACTGWNDNVRAMLAKNNPYKLVFVTANHKNSLLGSDSYAIETFRMAWQPLINQGSKIIAIRDVPTMRGALTCLQRHREQPLKCSLPADKNTLGPDRMMMATENMPGTYLIDLTKYICPDNMCRIALGGMTVFRDHHHLTSAFAGTLAPMITEQLANYSLLSEK